MAKAPAAKRQAKPQTTEKTQSQGGGKSVAGVVGSVYGYGNQLLTGLSEPPQGTYDTYRLMRCNPTIALAMAVALAPVKASSWSYELADDAPDDLMKTVQEVFDPLRFNLVRDMTRAVWMGHQPFEIVWEYADGLLKFSKIKPLLQDITELRVDERTGEFVGLKNTGEFLDDMHSFNFVYDGECGGQWGRSRMENIRKAAWSPWNDALKQNASFMQKGAGVIPIVHYPVGSSKDAQSGTEDSNVVHAKNLLGHLSGGRGIAIPMDFAAWADDVQAMLKSGINPKDMLAWQISFLETRSGIGGEIQSTMKHYESLMARGWLVPERTFMEGTTGTKAEAGVHGDVALYAAEELNQDIADTVNKELLQPFLYQNFGESRAKAVKIVPAPLRDDTKAFIRKITEMVVTNPANVDLVLTALDFDAMLDQSGLPKGQEVVDLSDLAGKIGPDSVDPNADQPTDQTTPDPVLSEAQTANSDLVDTALNGAQLASMVTLIKELTTQQLPASVVLNMIKMAFPAADEALVNKIVADAAKFKPKEAKAKPMPTRVPPTAKPPAQTVAMSRLYHTMRAALVGVN